MSNPNEGKKKSTRGRGYYSGRPFFEKKRLDPSVFLNNTLQASERSSTFYNRIPYKGWRFYFPNEAYENDSNILIRTRAAENYFRRNKATINIKDVEEKRFFNLDLKVLNGDGEILAEWSTFSDDIVEDSEKTINCLGLALHQTVLELMKDEKDFELPSVRIRLQNFEPIVPLKDIKAGLFGKLISVRGTVIRVSANKLLCVAMGFGCNTCFATMSLPLKDGIYKMPTRCDSDKCRSKSFTPLCSSKLTQTKSYQIMKVQENIAEEQSDGGRIPRTVEVDLTDDLVDSCGPGDNVTITGIVKVRSSEEAKKTKTANLFSLYIHAVTVITSKGVNTTRQGHCNVEFSIKDYYAIQEIHSEPSQLRLLVNSLCPTVYGQEMVKAGLLLALVGGSSTNRRPDPHVLIVGDPGLGKSHLLHACAQVSPRGVYVCGNTTTSSGLTVTLVKEGGDFALEAGALVLANHGCCCIDEFDKMTSQHQALLEAMEQQRISVAKGGVVCSLPAHASIIAAANPSGGHYNRTRTVAENLKMNSALLSRFDLVFILLDRPDEQLDSLLSEHVMTLHAGLKGKKRLTSSRSSFVSFSTESSESAETDLPLSEKLKLRPDESVDLVPHGLLRKYIAYVRKYVPQPQLSEGAAEILQTFYLELRKVQDSTPVTTRQLESMIRLTQARAKLELREEATTKDAADIVQLMRWAMRDVLTGNLDSRLSQNGAGMSQGSKAKRFIVALQTKAKLENKDQFTVAEFREVASLLKLHVPDFFQFISVLNVQGFIIKRGFNTYQLLSL